MANKNLCARLLLVVREFKQTSRSKHFKASQKQLLMLPEPLEETKMVLAYSSTLLSNTYVYSMMRHSKTQCPSCVVYQRHVLYSFPCADKSCCLWFVLSKNCLLLIMSSKNQTPSIPKLESISVNNRGKP